jgi:hypothetical protein
MERIESANAVDAGYASKTEQLSQLQAELAACPPNHYTKCRTPLLQAIQSAQNAPDTLRFDAQNAGENRYWIALAAWYNDGKLQENHVDAGTIALYVFAGMGLAGSLFAVFAFGVHGASVSRVEYQRPTPTSEAERIHERNERIQQTYRHRLEAAGVTVPPADTVLDQPISSPETSERIHERTSTLKNASDTLTDTLSHTPDTLTDTLKAEAEEGGDTLPSEGDTYEGWKQAVVNGQCETIVRDMRLWLQDVGAVEPGKTKQAQLVAESYLMEAEAEGFVREIPNWVSGMRRKYEWTGQGA